jgi:hypothetical protein
MKQSFTALLLATALLLVGSTACSKKEEDPAPTPTPTIIPSSETGSYTLDGRTTPCVAKCIVAEDYDANKQPIHKLLVSLFSGGTTSLPTEVAVLTFTKPFGADVSAYQFQGVNIRSENVTPRTQRSYSSAKKYTVTKTSSGGYSGTFEATSDATTATPANSSITKGVFTDVHQ